MLRPVTNLTESEEEPEATQAEKPSEEPKGKDKVVPKPKRSPKTVSTTAASSASAAPRRGRPPKATSGGRKRAAAKKAATAKGKAKAKAKGKTIKKPATSETTEVEDGDGPIPKTSKRPTAMKRLAAGNRRKSMQAFSNPYYYGRANTWAIKHNGKEVVRDAAHESLLKGETIEDTKAMCATMMSKLTRNSGRDNGKSETPADNGTADSTPKTPKHAKHVTDDAMDNDETGNDCPHGGSEEDREEEAMEDDEIEEP